MFPNFFGGDLSPGVEPRDCVLSYLTVQGATPPQAIEAASCGGFGAVTIRVVPPASVHPSAAEVATMAMPRQTATCARAAAVAIADVEYVNLGPDWRLDDAHPLVDVGAELGARCINVMGTDPDEARLTVSYGALCELAAAAGLTAALEFSAYSEVRSLDQAQRIAAAVGGPAASVVVDALHLARAGSGVETVAAAVKASPDLFGALHLCDGPAIAADPTPTGLADESRQNRLLPGDGELPLAQLLRVLPDARRYVEAPVRASAGAPFGQRAAAAAAALRSLPTGMIEGALR